MKPAYISASSIERDTLLSQNENFSTNEREIFQWLCNHYNEQIPYKTTLDTAYAKYPDAKSTLTMLLAKLRQSGLGIMRSEIVERELQASYIVLTDRFSDTFTVNLVEELTLEAIATPGKPLPLLSEVHKMGYSNLASTVKKVPLQEIGSISEKIDPPQAVLLEIIEKECLFVSSRKINLLMDALILELRYFFVDPDLLGVIAKKIELTFTDLKGKIKTTNVDDWQRIANGIIKFRSDIFAQTRRETSKEILMYAIVLSRYLGTVIQSKEKEKEKQQEKQLMFNDLLTAIRENPNNIMSAEAFTALLTPLQEKLGDEFPDFIQEFNAAYVKNMSASVTPIVLLLENGYIHMHKFFSYFYDEFLILQRKLKEWVETEIYEGIRSNITSHMMISYNNFSAALQKEISQKNPLIATVFKRPSILADSVLNHAKHILQSANSKDMERLLRIFFKSETMELKRYDEIFDLNFEILVEKAWRRLPLLLRIWWKFTGKQKQIINRFTTNFRNPKTGMDEGLAWTHIAGSEKIEETHFIAGRDALARNKENIHTDQKGTLVNRRKRNAEVKQNAIDKTKQQKQVNSQDIDKLWKDFENVLKRD